MMEIDDPDSSSFRPRRRFGFLALTVVALASAGAALAATSYLRHHEAGTAAPSLAADKTSYVCPMHPTVVSDHPADCPVCGMKLVPAEAPSTAPHDGAQAAAAATHTTYVCPMHPTVVDDHESDCPVCGMKLVPTEAASGASADVTSSEVTRYGCPMHPDVVQDHPGDCPACAMKLVPLPSASANAEKSVPGMATVDIDPTRQQLIGLRTAEVKQSHVGGSFRTVGKVAFDETRVRQINLKVPAYVERVYVDFVGKLVARGEPLFSLYSPELLAAQEELLLALRTKRSLDRTGAMAADGDALVHAARKKLSLWDVPEAEIKKLERSKKAKKALTFHSPIAGVVTKKDVVEGARLEPGATPYEIVDLSKVWVLADVYESELRHVRSGMSASLTLNAYPGRVFSGAVSFVDPLLDPKTRTVRVRLAFENPSGELRPEMFGDVTLRARERDGLSIPADAVLDSGTMRVVFVSLGEGKFQPRQVSVGDRSGNDVEVLDGLTAGEHVVVGANFLVDSESRLRASLRALSDGHDEPVPLHEQGELAPTAQAEPEAEPAPHAERERERRRHRRKSRREQAAREGD